MTTPESHAYILGLARLHAMHLEEQVERLERAAREAAIIAGAARARWEEAVDLASRLEVEGCAR